jgi:HlyD family secretion protein
MKVSISLPPTGAPARWSRAALLAGLGGLWLLAGGCREQPAGAYPGYLEAEFVHVAAPLAGRLDRLAVTRGQEVRAGELLFDLEQAAEAAAAEEAARRVDQARARLDNLHKGRRPTELATLEAQLARAEANLRLSEIELARREQLRRDAVIAPADLDLARARRDADAAQVEALRAELATARLGAREDEIRAAEAEWAAATAGLARARWAVEQKHRTAPVAGRVHDTLYREGEFVPAGQPVVVLLPPENVKARFFVPETDVATLQVGGRVEVRADGWPAPRPATIRYIATRAEYTPPVIYSRENRAKLVFLVEAVFAPAEARDLPPGLPVEVTRLP